MSLTKAAAALQFNACDFFGTKAKPFNLLPSQTQRRSFILKPLVVEARANARTESAKIRNRRIQKKFNGTPTKPRLSVFCSDKQLYAMLVDDQNKKCLFFGSTLQQSIRGNGNPPCSTIFPLSRKLLSVLVKSLSRLVLHLTLRKFHLMIVMAPVVVRECKPLRFQYPVMASCNKDRLSFLLFLTVSLCHAKFRLTSFA
ncbi:hypothetical protein CISIN_1g029135mg [Citrus sinensis]|uniref:Uncharacterized protein n=1 Tax=Citrus sinensis TaxID=2711 RepID=A0A067GT94_CITSI|nr:hypothetical protein CISIN_1g029135mg [Citrus sinensis]